MKTVRFEITDYDHDRAKAIAKKFGYKLSKIYELALSFGLDEITKKPKL
jgi:hypothetical protein